MRIAGRPHWYASGDTVGGVGSTKSSECAWVRNNMTKATANECVRKEGMRMSVFKARESLDLLAGPEQTETLRPEGRTLIGERSEGPEVGSYRG